MDASKKHAAAGVAAGIGATLVLLAAIGVTVAYTGIYNIAATEEHASLTRWFFDTTFHNSIEHHAEGVPVPNLTPDMVATGCSGTSPLSSSNCRP